MGGWEGGGAGLRQSRVEHRQRFQSVNVQDPGSKRERCVRRVLRTQAKAAALLTRLWWWCKGGTHPAGSSHLEREGHVGFKRVELLLLDIG